MMHNLPLIITLVTLILPIVFKSTIFKIASCILLAAFPSFTAAVRERGKRRFPLRIKQKKQVNINSDLQRGKFSLIILKIAICILIVLASRIFSPFTLKRQTSVFKRLHFLEHFVKLPQLIV